MTLSLQKLLETDRIPSLPEVALRVVELAQAPEPDLEEIIRVIKGDPAICSRVMRTVNSALFGLRRRVSSIDAAVPVLGANLVRTLVLSFSLADHHGPSIRYRRTYQELWRSCITQAVAAEALAQQLPGVDDSIWFLGGLLQDIGRLVLLAAAPEEYSRMLNTLGDGPDFLAAELRMFGFTHVDVSTQLALRWRLDHYLVDAIGKHHTTIRLAAEAEAMPHDVTLPYLPNALRCGAIFTDYLESLRAGREVCCQKLVDACHGVFSLSADELSTMLTEIVLRTNEVAALFSVDVGDCPAIESILARAQTTLASIALQSQLEVVAVRRHIEDAKRELECARTESNEWRLKAHCDDLTGALSRKVLLSAVSELQDQCVADERLLGVLFLDLDEFKCLNDNFGHHLGDEALQRVVEVIRATVRETDRVIRYGGDEFVVLMLVAVGETLARVAERIRSRVQLIRFGDEARAQVSCSLGGIVCDPSDGPRRTAEQLIDEADQAMYLAKQRGGNQCVLFDLQHDQRMTMDISGLTTTRHETLTTASVPVIL